MGGSMNLIAGCIYLIAAYTHSIGGCMHLSADTLANAQVTPKLTIL